MIRMIIMVRHVWKFKKAITLTGQFRLVWAECGNRPHGIDDPTRIEGEWIRSLERQRPDLIGKLGVRRDTMRDAIPDWEVPETAWAFLANGIELPAPNDTHVLAAAIAGHALHAHSPESHPNSMVNSFRSCTSASRNRAIDTTTPPVR